MFDRKEAKAKAKAAFKANYWKCVLVAIILFAIVGSASATVGSASERGVDSFAEQYEVETTEYKSDLELFIDQVGEGRLIAILIAIIVAAVVVGIVSTLINVFVLNPLEVGCRKFFLDNSEGPAPLGCLAYGFDHGYMRTVGAIFLRNLFEFLWALLFIIPGIIKHYSYYLVPYILIDNPELSAREAIKKSREMMKGHKWEAFVMELSFILWIILGGITFGLVLLFHVNPYISATHAEFYKQIKAQA